VVEEKFVFATTATRFSYQEDTPMSYCYAREEVLQPAIYSELMQGDAE